VKTASLIPVLLLGFGAAGCQTVYHLTHPSIPACEASLIPTESMGPEFWVRYEVRVRRGDIDQRFSLVAEKTELGLAVIAFNRFGAEIFSLLQVGTEIRLGGPVLQSFAPPPENVLGDLHRLRFTDDAEIRADGRAIVYSCGTRTIFVRIEERPAP
jgi:hypothetical protein